MSALFRLSGRWALLPKALQIPICYDRLSNPLFRGGFADVWKGEHLGRSVAVKVLRVYATSDIETIARVSSQNFPKMARWSTDAVPLLEVLQGGRVMERSSPSKCAPFFGCYNGERPTCNDFRMDGEWQYQ